MSKNDKAELIEIEARKLINDSAAPRGNARGQEDNTPLSTGEKSAGADKTIKAAKEKIKAEKEAADKEQRQKEARLKKEKRKKAKLKGATKPKDEATPEDPKLDVGGNPISKKKERLIEKAMKARRLSPEEILEEKHKSRSLVIRAAAASLALLVLGGGGTWAATGPFSDFFSGTEEVVVIEKRKMKLNKSISFAGVQFGMTRTMLQEKENVIRVDEISSRETALSFGKDGGAHTVWFREEGGLDEAWKVRYRQPAKTGNIDSAIKPLLKKLGPVYESSCSKSSLTTKTNCTFRWFGGNGVDVTLNARTTVTNDGQSETALIVTAEDRRVIQRQQRDRRLRAEQERQVALKAAKGETEVAENTLPAEDGTPPTAAASIETEVTP